MPRFQLRPAAETDLDDAFAWYEMQRHGLGLEFLTSVEATMVRLQRAPQLFPVVYRDVRRALVRKFPYAIYYVATDSLISVIACTHVRRHPQRWQSRR